MEQVNCENLEEIVRVSNEEYVKRCEKKLLMAQTRECVAEFKKLCDYNQLRLLQLLKYHTITGKRLLDYSTDVMALFDYVKKIDIDGSLKNRLANIYYES